MSRLSHGCLRAKLEQTRHLVGCWNSQVTNQGQIVIAEALTKKYGSPGPRAGAGGPHNGAWSNGGHRDQPQLSIPADSGLTDGHQEQMLRHRAFKVVDDHPQVDRTVTEAMPDKASQRPSKIMGPLLGIAPTGDDDPMAHVSNRWEPPLRRRACG